MAKTGNSIAFVIAAVAVTVIRPAYVDINSYGMVYIFNNSANVSCNCHAHIGDK